MGYIGCPGCASDPGYSLEKYRWFGAEHGALVGILFSGSLIAFFTQLYILKYPPEKWHQIKNLYI